MQPPEAVSDPTKIVFTKNPLMVISGNTIEEGRKEKYEDSNTGIIQYQYSGTVRFLQTVTLKAKVKTNLKGRITYQACKAGLCLTPQTVPFSLPL